MAASWLAQFGPTLGVALILGIVLVLTLRLADKREAQRELERRQRQFGTPLPR